MKTDDQLIAIMDGECNIDIEIDQTKYPRPDWAVKQIVRSSGLVENICRHGIGHPHPASVQEFEAIGVMSMGVHGCDFCCCDDETKARILSELNPYHGVHHDK